MSSELPRGWIYATIEDIATTGTGGTPRRNNEDYYGGEIPWVKSGDLNDGLVNQIGEKITQSGLDNSNAKLFPKGTICVALYGATVGKLGILSVTAATNQAICGIFPENNIDKCFIFYALKNIRHLLISQAQGGAQPNISNGIVKKTTLPIPPTHEQTRIVTAIESLQQRSARARTLLMEVEPLIGKFRQSILQSAFSGRLTADWRAKNPDVEPADQLLDRIRVERRQRWEDAELAKFEKKGKKPPKGWQEKYEEPELVDESGLPKLPNGWCWESLESLVPAEFPIVYGIIQAGPQIPGGVPYVRPTDIRESEIDLAELPRTTVEIAAKYERSKLQTGDLVYSIVGTIGKTLIVDNRLDGANITQSSVRIRMLKPINALMILRVLQSELVTRQMDQMKFGNAVQRLNVDHVRKLAIPVPPFDELTQLSRLIESSFTKLEALSEYSDSIQNSLNSLHKSILGKAFRGQLTAQNPTDEPASALLTRIQAARKTQESPKKSTKKNLTIRKKKPSKLIVEAPAKSLGVKK